MNSANIDTKRSHYKQRLTNCINEIAGEIHGSGLRGGPKRKTLDDWVTEVKNVFGLWKDGRLAKEIKGEFAVEFAEFLFKDVYERVKKQLINQPDATYIRIRDKDQPAALLERVVQATRPAELNNHRLQGGYHTGAGTAHTRASQPPQPNRRRQANRLSEEDRWRNALIQLVKNIGESCRIYAISPNKAADWMNQARHDFGLLEGQSLAREIKSRSDVQFLQRKVGDLKRELATKRERALEETKHQPATWLEALAKIHEHPEEPRQPSSLRPSLFRRAFTVLRRGEQKSPRVLRR